jgi:curved DNA-binding protein CbpA
LKNYYDMLSVGRQAPADEIKKAFRREIARYHPDKVQHLGPEFQEMASSIAADLTEAYRILMDPALRAKYDAEADAPRMPPPPPPPRPAGDVPPPPPPVDPPPSPPPPSRSSAGVDFVRRASLSKMKNAIADVLGNAEALTAYGFDLAILTRPRKGLFRKVEESICLVIKFVPFVDAAAISDVWLPASKVRAPGADGCAVLLLGQGVAPARDLAAAVSELRRKSRGAGPLIVPVDVRDWDALFPPETPAAVRSLIQRLKEEQR